MQSVSKPKPMNESSDHHLRPGVHGTDERHSATAFLPGHGVGHIGLGLMSSS
jgi:hypothetical protein